MTLIQDGNTQVFPIVDLIQRLGAFAVLEG
jgi:hypothetical protein